MSWTFAPPVSSPPFFYIPTRGLYVIIDHTIYPRESSDRIHYLLTYKDPGPALNKAGKPRKHQPPPHQDETAQFYMAQLQLYGLEPVNSGKAAKKALLAALQGPRGLEPSEHIYGIGIDLADEYREKNAAAEAELKEQKRRERALRKEAKAEENRKRQRDEEEGLVDVQAPARKKKKSKKGSRRVGKSKLSGFSKIAASEVAGGSEVSEPLLLQLAPSSTGEHVAKHEDEEEEGKKFDAGNENGEEE